MHLLAISPGEMLDGGAAVDLGQSAGDLVILSAADSDLACLSAAAARLGPNAPKVRLANLLRLKHPLSVDLYVERVIEKARFVCVRVIGGRSYWPYGLEEIAQVCRERRIPLAVMLDDQDDYDGAALSTTTPEARARLAAYLRQGGAGNAQNFLLYARSLAGLGDGGWAEPAPVLDAGLYWPGKDQPSLRDIQSQWASEQPTAAIVFYRSLVAAAGTAAIDAMIQTLAARGVNALPVFVQSLKTPFCAQLVTDLFAKTQPDVVLNATAFSTSSPGDTHQPGPLDSADAAVLQIVFAGIERQAWQASSRGLSARDLAMNVVLPEVDGRILAGAVAFKAEARFDALTECPILGHEPDPARIEFAADLAAAWARLRRTQPADRRVGLILANYPNRDGRLGNGVGLDTPASTANILSSLREAGYDTGKAPSSGKSLMARLLKGPTNARHGQGGEVLSLADYLAFWNGLDPAIREGVETRWGQPSGDPFYDPEADGFRLPIHRFGKVCVGVQPARGYNLDPKTSYHDPALVPPHGYLAFYAWLRRDFDAHALVHVGKHGNLEWLPGKALALSDACYPLAISGPTPQLYPFIVNDPGEGCQAKRRIGAVIIDHLTPPLTRAESYGPLKALEALVDEYYLAAGLDPRRLAVLREDILTLARSQGLDADAGADFDDPDQALTALDAYLCDLKEMQIRNGLHVFGASPEAGLRADLLVALSRTPRRLGTGRDASLLRVLAADLGIADGFDPLDCAMAEPWDDARPEALSAIDDQPWRTKGDTVERLEALAHALIGDDQSPDPRWVRTMEVLASLQDDIAPNVDACGGAEIAALLIGLAGRFVAPGPSGAPTRGRPEVLPTGRNFYAVDTRAVPTPAAWALGFKSAQLLVEDHLQRTGRYPEAMAVTAWGTSNMRTGGDDVAQALALMGARPTWEHSTGRVTGFEILPLGVLGRPRVDVTVRISGFFRDAFADQIDLLASAAAAVMELDERADDNPAAARCRAEGATAESRVRVFGSKPGAYGAGLQAMIDERLWDNRGDLAEAYLVWGGYAYAAGLEGQAARPALERRLSRVDAVVQNQDNREHDLLDSDDYYQFEGGMFAAVEKLKGTAPIAYHNDHSRPERPVIRTLDDEIGRIVHARLVNPKWIKGVMRHGYKGAFEIAASVDYLFAFAAATGLVRDHHFDLAYEAFILDDVVRDFMADANPDALAEMASTLNQAIDRGLWRPKSNSAGLRLADLVHREAAL
jgi:cobaltochelatase CobN